MQTMTEAEYNAIHPDYRGVWTTEHTDWPDWEAIRSEYIGKRTLMREGALEVEGLSFLIID